MRYLICVALAFSFLPAVAQEEISILPLQRKHEVGFLSELGFNENYAGPAIGLQYKYWRNVNERAIRGNIGYTQHTYTNGKTYFPAQGDTVLSKIALTEVPTIQAGIGVEKQRHFYKNLYMYAAIDLYGAYGFGNTRELFQKEVTKDDITHQVDQAIGATYSTKLFKIGVLPTVGIKFQFSRVSFGTELSGLRMEYRSLTNGTGGPKNTGGITDFNMGSFTQRIFVSFRF